MENFIDDIIPVNFTLGRNGETTISVQEYIKLKAHVISYEVGSGKNIHSYEIVHTTAGFVDIGTNKSGTFAKWLSDPFEIKAVLVDEKNDHYAELDINNKTVRVPFESFLSNKIDVALFNKGVAICKTNKAHEALSMHLQWLLGKFEEQDARQILGWKFRNDELTWNGTNIQPPLLQYRLSEESEEIYIKKLNSFINDMPELQFVMCSAAASTLLAYLNMTEKVPVASFGVSLVGTSSTGKTTALQLASSLYSSPDDDAVFSGFYGTSNALIYMLGRHHGIPLCYDESTISNNISKENFIYAFAEGKDKLRLNQDSTLKERNSWLCTCLFSSETHLVDIAENDNLGLGVRIINLENCTYTRDSLHSEQIKTFSGKNYGIVGNMLSNYLIKSDSGKIKDEYDTIKSELSALLETTKCPLTDRLILNYSLIIYTSEIFNKLGIATDTDAVRNICTELHDKISADAYPGKNAVIKIFNYISSEYKHLKGLKWTTNKDGNPVKVAIIETTFTAILEQIGINDFKIAVNYLDREGFLVRQSRGRIKSKLNIDGVPCYAYQIDILKVSEAFGSINDDVFSNVRKYKHTDPFSDEILDIVNDEEAIIHAGNYKISDNKTTVSGKAFLL